MKPLLDIHTHTVASGHAYSSLAENVEEASKKGLALIGITDHAPAMPGSVKEVYFSNFNAVPGILYGVEVFLGAELNILDEQGKVDMPERILKKMDYTIASLHHLCIAPAGKKENTTAVLNAMENPYVSIIGHPGDPKFPLDAKKIVLASKRTGTLLELNESSLNPSGSRIGSDERLTEILEICKKEDVPVVMGTDAHFCTQVGDFTRLIQFVEKNSFPTELILNRNVDCFKQSLKKK